MNKMFIRINDTSGITIISTVECEVIISDAEDGHTWEKAAEIGTFSQIQKARDEADAADKQDPNYVEDWIYEDELDGDMMRDLFRKRGHRTAVIDEEDQCGDDTCEYFTKNVKIGDEHITTTQNGWRVFRTGADYLAHVREEVES